MSVLERDYQVIFSYLRSLNFHYLNDWVVQCVCYCKSTDPNISLERIKEIVKEQWLLVNLRNIKVPALPPNLVALDKTILPGKYVVQVETMVDCSRSCYSQFQEIQKVNIDSVEESLDQKGWDIKSNRCLIFTISDGVQEIKAMEYTPIKKIRTNDPELLPGFKMLIIGPVECRKGMVLLKEENVKIHGGEVDTMTITNSLRSVLMRKLNLNEEDYPDKTGNLKEAKENNILNERMVENSVKQATGSEVDERTHFETLLSQNDDLFLTLPLESESFDQEGTPGTRDQSKLLNGRKDEIMNSRNNSVYENLLTDDFSLDKLNVDSVFDDSFATIFKKHDLPPEEKTTPSPKKLCESDNLEEVTEKLSVPSLQNKRSVSRQNNNLKDNLSNSNNYNKKCNWSISNQERPTQSLQTTISAFFKTSQIPENSSSSHQSTSKLSLNQPVTISSKPFVYLKQLQMWKLDRPVTHIIKANILTLKKKITIENDEFDLVGTITDGSLSLDARFCSDAIESLLGYSPCEMQEMMKSKHLNSAVAERISEVFKKAQQKFINLNCLMKIRFLCNSDLPLILAFEEITREHLKALKDRALNL